MQLFELAEQLPDGYRNEKDDNTVMKLGDLRKTRLTLAHLNRLRMANDVRRFEFEKKLEAVKDQYAAPPAEGGMPAM